MSDCCSQGALLRTHGQAKGAVLYVAADADALLSSVVDQECRTDTKPAKGSIGIRRSLKRHLPQGLDGGWSEAASVTGWHHALRGYREDVSMTRRVEAHVRSHLVDRGDVDDLTKEFLAESQESIDRMERCLTDLEAQPDNADLIAEIFRAVHTIKGATGFLGLSRLERLAHAGEHLLGALREGSLRVSAEIISGLLKLSDSFRAILLLLEQSGGEGNRRSDQADDEALLELLVHLQQVKVQEPLRAVPPPQKPLPELQRRPQETATPTAPEKIELAPARNAEAEPTRSAEVSAVEESFQGSLSAKTLRVEVNVLNRMMDLIGELVLTRNQMLQGRMEAAKLPELSRRLDCVTSDLRETVMQARMQPVSMLFGRFPRVARDLARICGRRVRLEFSGQETGLDKSVLEALKDPLTHAIRNAIDHGIEAPAERLTAGKPIEGVLRVRAYHQNGSVVIEVSDDGAGISREAVLRRAVELGFTTDDRAASMSDRDAWQFIFQPGFSTAKELTHVSGRGVGMDVVRSNVEGVGGTVELDSVQGIGTTLRLRVPLTLAIIPALIVRSAGEIFALPQNALIELVYVSASERNEKVESIGGAEVYHLRDTLLSIVRLDRVLRLETPAPDLEQGFYIAVVECDGCKYGLAVDDLLTPEEIVVKPLSDVLRQMRLFAGATILGDGGLALILDIAALAARAKLRPVMGKSTTATVSLQQSQKADPLFLVFEEKCGERSALPLSHVERIETISPKQVEYVQGRPVLQYRGGLLTLVDRSRLLSSNEDRAEQHEQLTALICRNPAPQGGGAAQTGLLVRKVVDVGTSTKFQFGTSTQDEKLTVIKDRVTLVDKNINGLTQSRLEVA